jgi:outer membrane protein OmpA-like peptidoglycan-associated protein/opacity protein-like surface antigen
LVAFLLLPALLAQDSAKPAATAKALVTPAPATSPEVIRTHAVPAAPSSGLLVVSKVTLDKRESGETFVDVSTSRTATYRVMSLKSPARLVVDIDSAKNTSHQQFYSADTLVLRDVRLAQYRATDPSVVRVVADLKGDPTFDVHATPAGVRIDLRPRGMAKSALSAVETTTPAPETKPAAAVATAPVASDHVMVAQINLPEAPAAVKDGAVKSPGASVAVATTKPAASASMPGTAKRPWGGPKDTPPKVELFMGFSYLRNVPASVTNRIDWVPGGTMSLAINANRYLGFVADVGGYHATNFGPGAPPTGGTVPAYGDLYSYMFGPRLSFRHERATPFIQALFGGVHASDVTLNGCTGIGCTPLPFENAFAMAAGGGVDVTVSRHVAIRVIQAEYMMTRFQDPTSSTGATERQNDIRLSAGIVLRFGGEHRAPPPPPPPSPQPPVAACSADKGMVYAESGDVVGVRAQASSPDNNPLTYSWTATGGAVQGTGSDVQWNSSGVAAGTYTVSVRVDDGKGGRANCSVGIRVDPRPIRPPTMSCSADRQSIMVGERAQITATVSNPDNVPLTYSWRTNGGQIIGSGPSVSFDSSGLAANRYTVMGRVDNGRGGTADCSVNIDAQVPQAAVMPAELEARLALHSIYFPTAQPTADNPGGGLTESQQTTLRTLASDFKTYLQFKPEAHLTLEGHADPRGSVEYNNALTERRVARSKSFLVEQGVPAGSIETRSFGKQDVLSAAQVRQQMRENPDLTPEDRQRLLSANLNGIVLAQNRRVDVVLSVAGQKSTRRYPFNAKDAVTLLDDNQLVR